MYETPRLERFGKLREVTRSGGMTEAADATNPFHRYAATG